MLSDPLWFSTSFANVGKPSSSIDDLRSSYYETPPLFTFRTSFLTPVELEDSSLSSCFQKSACWVFSCRLTWEFVGWISAWVPHQFPGAREHRLVLFRQSLDRRGCSNLEEGSSSHSTGCATPDSWVWTSPSPNSLALVLPPVNLHWKSLLVLSLTWHSVSWSDKKITVMAAREHREMHDVEPTKKMIPLVTRGAPFGQHMSELVFGVNILDLNFWFQIDSVEQPIKRNPVGSGHVSHCWTSSFDDHLDHIRCPQRCTTETPLEKNVCLWVRGPHATVDQHLGCSFSVGVLVLVFLLEWLPVPHQFPVASLIGLLVMLVESNTSITTSQRSRGNSTSIRSPASN